MNQHEAPNYTIATIGHPANGIHIIKNGRGQWLNVETGRFVDPEDFRAGWDIVYFGEVAPAGAPCEALNGLDETTCILDANHVHTSESWHKDVRGTQWNVSVFAPAQRAEGVTQQVLVIERVNVITGTRELLDVVRDIEAAANVTMRGVEGWRQGSDRVWSVDTERTGVVLTATPRDLSL